MNDPILLPPFFYLLKLMTRIVLALPHPVVQALPGNAGRTNHWGLNGSVTEK
jgi:hypothetical protein